MVRQTSDRSLFNIVESVDLMALEALGLLKLLFLVLNRSEMEWKMGPREWVMAKAQFAVIFGERFTRAMAA